MSEQVVHFDQRHPSTLNNAVTPLRDDRYEIGHVVGAETRPYAIHLAKRGCREFAEVESFYPTVVHLASETGGKCTTDEPG